MATFTANSTQLLYGSKVYEVLQYYYSPAGANAVTGLQNTLYAFIGDVDPWVDEYNPPAPTQDQYSIKQIYKNITLVQNKANSDISSQVVKLLNDMAIQYKILDSTDNLETINNLENEQEESNFNWFKLLGLNELTGQIESILFKGNSSLLLLVCFLFKFSFELLNIFVFKRINYIEIIVLYKFIGINIGLCLL